MDSEEYRKKIERDILDIMEEKLLARQMNAERAVNIARYILDTLKPHMTIEQIHKVAQEFDDHFAELAPISQVITVEHEEEIKKQLIPMVEKLLKEGKIEEADKIIETSKTSEDI